MNKKGFIDEIELSPGVLILTAVGFVVGLIGAKAMGAGVIYRMVVAMACAIAGFAMASFVASR